MEEANRDLASMVVKSPEKLRMDLAQLSEKQTACGESVKSLKDQLEDKVKLADIHEKENQKQKLRAEILNQLLNFKKDLRYPKSRTVLNNFCVGRVS